MVYLVSETDDEQPDQSAMAREDDDPLSGQEARRLDAADGARTPEAAAAGEGISRAGAEHCRCPQPPKPAPTALKLNGTTYHRPAGWLAGRLAKVGSA